MKSWTDHWYGVPSAANTVLAPLAGLYRGAVALRRHAYDWGLCQREHFPVPVIVVGNITVGGTGKTPLVIWLATFLKQRGYRPGIVSRGYGGRPRQDTQRVTPDSDPVLVGDEAVLLARRSGCPMVVGVRRPAAVRRLLAETDCNVIVSDDGLQHYALARDLEIAVLDGQRGIGNGRCLPAGPLREPLRRLEQVDFCVVNGGSGVGAYHMKLVPEAFQPVGRHEVSRPLSAFRGQRVHAVAGIGHPQRFFASLAELGMEVVPHPFPDHHRYCAADLQFNDDLPMVMTEKDAVKCERLGLDNAWYLPITAQMDAEFGQVLMARLAAGHLNPAGERSDG